jgi:hypothetical protein
LDIFTDKCRRRIADFGVEYSAGEVGDLELLDRLLLGIDQGQGAGDWVGLEGETVGIRGDMDSYGR